MKISDRIYLAGSEQFVLSHPLDCNCYLIDGGNASGLIDTGLGLGVDDILKNVADDGFDPGKISHVWKYKLPVFLSGQSSGWGTVARAREFEKYLKSGSVELSRIGICGRFFCFFPACCRYKRGAEPMRFIAPPTG